VRNLTGSLRLAVSALLLALAAPTSPVRAVKPPFLNAADFPSIQAAIDALGKDGGTVMIPAGRYDATTTPAFVPPLRLPPRTPVRVLGAGREATVLESRDPDQDLCRLQAGYQSVEHLTLLGAASKGLKGRGNGIVVGTATGDKAVLAHDELRDVIIRGANRHGIYVKGLGSDNDSLAILCTYDGVVVDSPDSSGVLIDGRCTTQFFRDCSFWNFKGYGAHVHGTGHQFSNCDFEQSPDGPASLEFLFLDGCFGTDVRNCWFEDQRANTQPPYFVRTRAISTHISIDQCSFYRRHATRVRGILVETWMHSLTITNPLFSARDVPGAPFDPRDQVTLRGYKGSLTDSQRITVTIVGGVTSTTRAYYPLVTTDSLTTDEKPQPAVERVNPQGSK